VATAEVIVKVEGVEETLRALDEVIAKARDAETALARVRRAAEQVEAIGR
jgi:hypothetical protein